MSKTRAIIQDLLSTKGKSLAFKYKGREIDLLGERGWEFPEKLEEIFWAIVKPTHEDLVVIGPRGGGKTMVVAGAAGVLFALHDYDVFVVGGSEDQAMNCFKYVRQLLYSDPELSKALQDSLKKSAVTDKGNWFEITAASQKGVRGRHPGDPHPEMGWETHGGLLIKDERDEMDDEIADAVDFTMDVADPSIIVTTSTMHRDDGGGIAQMAEDAEARGARVIRFDILDVCKVCTHDCAKCPGGFPFAGALYGADPVYGKLENDAPVLPKVTTESMAAWNKFKAGNAWAADEPAYCLGRAKLHRPGHVKMSKIFRAFKRSRNRELFEVELMCRKRRGARRIVDGAALDRCLAEDVYYKSSFPTPIITIDWGLKGWCVVILVQKQDGVIAVIDVRYEHMMELDGIIDICKSMRKETGAYQVYADVSHPYNNLDLAKAEFDVTEVPFNTYKEMNAGWVKGIVERNQLRIRGKIQKPTQPGEKPGYIFYSDPVREFFNQLKGWQRDKNGKIVKKNDHGPDSFSCAGLHFVSDNEWEPEFQSLGRRESLGWGD